MFLNVLLTLILTIKSFFYSIFKVISKSMADFLFSIIVEIFFLVQVSDILNQPAIKYLIT